MSNSKPYDMFENLTFLLDSYEVKGINNSIVDKIRSILDEDEADALDEMLNAVRLPVDVESLEDGDVSVDDVVSVFKELVWENSDKWTDEMYNIPVNMMCYMNYIELRDFKTLVKKIKNNG